jgi:hypothetical protein
MPTFRLAGDVLIACNCDWGCPCNFNARPSRGFCQGGWIWTFERGQVDDVAVDGLGVALFAKWPGAIHEGGGRAACYIDARATIGGFAELELQTIRNPVTKAEVHPEMFLPEGLVVKRGNLAASTVFRVKGEFAYDHSGQYAAFGRFEYA